VLRNSNGEWLTVKQVSNVTGKSVNAIRMLLHRRKLDNVKKINNGGQREQWLIHKDTMMKLHNSDVTETLQDEMHNGCITKVHNSDVISLEYHDSKMKEWLQERDQLQAGLMMYRYKYEELDRQVKLLPAPVEVVTSRMPELETRVKELEAALEAEKKRNWWKKFLGLK
jgi:uncharacterized coiled-coil DUF342 family protein